MELERIEKAEQILTDIRTLEMEKFNLIKSDRLLPLTVQVKEGDESYEHKVFLTSREEPKLKYHIIDFFEQEIERLEKELRDLTH